MFDLMEDTTEEPALNSSLELDRIKDKIRAIWNRVIVAEYNEKYENQKEDSEDYVSLDDYIKDKQLYFPDDPRPDSEVNGILELLDGMFNDKEDLDPISKEGTAPTYSGKQLGSNNDKGHIESTRYEVKHLATKTPNDSQSIARSSGYSVQTGAIAPRKDSKVKETYRPMIEAIIEEMLSLEERQAIGRRRHLFR
jgi:hypothetical protein